MIYLNKRKGGAAVQKFTSFTEFIECLAQARFGFESIWEAIRDLYYSVTQNPDIESMWSGLMTALAPAANVIPFVIMLLGIVVGLFGKKMMWLIKFVAFFIFGFTVGVYFLAPVIPESIPIPAWVTGLVIAAISAVLYKFIYIIVYSVGITYVIYRLCYYGFFTVEEPEYTVGRMLTCLVVALIVLVISFLLFKFVEMYICSALGAWLLVGGFGMAFVDLGEIAALGDKSYILELSVILVLSVLAFIFQVKTRRRY